MNGPLSPQFLRFFSDSFVSLFLAGFGGGLAGGSLGPIPGFSALGLGSSCLQLCAEEGRKS